MGFSSDKVIARYKAMRRRGSVVYGSCCEGEDVREGGEVRGRAAFDAAAAGQRVVCASGDNPLCGDSLCIEVLVEKNVDGDDIVREARFDGYGCSLCLASADVLLEAVEGMKVCDALAFGCDDLDRAWGGLEIGRSRRACSELSVQVLRRALEGKGDA